MDIEFRTLELNPYSSDISFDTFYAGLGEWFLYENSFKMRVMLTWDVNVLWI